jgi:uncharacterized protein YndB with AHSA1/START domain
MKTTGLSLVLNRVIRAPRARVFQAFSSVDEFKKWFGPDDCRVLDGEVNFRKGGGYRLNMHTSSVGPAELFGAYDEIVPNERLRLTWTWRNNPAMDGWGTMSVTIEFADHRDGTLVTIQHDGLLNDEVREGHTHGWNGSLDKLAACCA